MVSIKTTKINISTSTWIGNYNSTLCLKSIFENCPIDDCILGMKYNCTKKGEISGSEKTFFNQITMRVKTREKETNMKVFSNGKIQLTGIKSKEQAIETATKVFERFKDISGFYNKKVFVDENGLHWDFEEYSEFSKISKDPNFLLKKVTLYKKTNDNIFELFGSKKVNSFTIDKKMIIFCNENKKLTDKTHVDKVKSIYDNTTGELLGYYTYTLENNRKNVILFKADYINTGENTWDIMNIYKRKIGQRTYTHIKDYPVIIEDSEETKEIKVKYNTILDGKKECSLELDITNINASFNVFLDGEEILLDKNSLHNFIQSDKSNRNLISYYSQDSRNQGIIFRIFNGKERKTTGSIFENGKVMLNGCISKQNISEARKIIMKVFKSFYEQTSALKEENTELKVESDLTIWDLM